MPKDVIDASIVGDYRVVLTFEGGEQRMIDLEELLSFDGVFRPLLDPEYFRRLRVEPDVGTIVWPNGADVCPDVLYEKSRPMDQVSVPVERAD
ncbi:MAG: DUF2442 domain-containing protein [Phycisphaerae bacterium]|nr:DUF2442 domain-containing protein [Phycisphaerae bacterium]